MTEEEILKDINNYISFANKSENFSDINEYIFCNELARRTEGLLDLYNKEKEKNNKLLKDNKELNDYITGLTIATGIALNGRTVEVSKKTLYELENTMKIEQVYIPETNSYRFRAI